MPERFCVFPWADTQRRACHWQLATRKLDMLNAAHDIRDLKVPPGNRLEALRGTWKGYHNIRINDQYRIAFLWTEDNAKDVLITDYH